MFDFDFKFLIVAGDNSKFEKSIFANIIITIFILYL